MLRVYLKPSAIYITPYSLGLCPTLEKSLSVWDMLEHRYTSVLYDYLAETGCNVGVIKIPRGITIDVVKSHLDQSGIQYNIIDDTDVYSKPKKANINTILDPKDDIETRAIDFLENTNDRQMFLTLDVGKGKTYCTTKYICDSSCVAMVISFNLSQQWYDRIQQYTNAIGGKDVQVIVGSQFFEDCVKERIHPKAAIYLTSIGTLTSYANLHGKDSLQQIADVLGIGIKVFDEAHMRYIQFNDIDLNMQVAKTIYLTATPGRSEYREDRMYSKIYSGVKTHGGYTALLTNHYVIHYVNYDSHSKAVDREHMKTPKGLSSLKYSRYLFDKYKDAILNLIWYYAKPILKEDKTKQDKILIVTDWLQDIDFIKSYFVKYCPEYIVGTYCLLVSSKEAREKELNANIIIGTIGSMQNGKDISNLRAIFPITQFSSSIVARQLLGRLRPIKNKEVYYYDMADVSVPAIMDQRRRRDAVFQMKCKGVINSDEVDLDRF